jgi:hypothetical protein
MCDLRFVTRRLPPADARALDGAAGCARAKSIIVKTTKITTV